MGGVPLSKFHTDMENVIFLHDWYFCSTILPKKNANILTKNTNLQQNIVFNVQQNHYKLF